MKRYEWSKLNPLQLGRYAEYLAMMEFTLYGFDVYSAEVDDKGIDFIIRKSATEFFEIQVKSVRGFNYIFMLKEKFKLHARLLAMIVLCQEFQPPQMFLIPSTEWLNNTGTLLADRDYVGKKSKPEWGINMSKKNMSLLKEYRFETSIESL